MSEAPEQRLLEVAGRPLADDQAGPLTWDLWMDRQ
jgi:hypothetical protein